MLRFSFFWSFQSSKIFSCHCHCYDIKNMVWHKAAALISEFTWKNIFCPGTEVYLIQCPPKKLEPTDINPVY